MVQSLVAILVSTFVYGVSARAEVQYRNIGDATHVEISDLENYDYKIDREKDRVILTLKNTEQAAVAKLMGLSDERIKDVKVKEVGDRQVQISFTLAQENLSFFDYQTESPTRLVLDIFSENSGKKPTAKESRNSEVKESNKKSLVSNSKSSSKVSTKLTRKTASVEKPEVTNKQPELPGDSKPPEPTERLGLFDGGDPDLMRFTIKAGEVNPEAYIKSRQNIYLHFPKLIIEHAYLDELVENWPEYDVPVEKSEQNLQFRLLMRLHKEKKGALFLRALRFFREKFPESAYDETIGFAEADAYYFMWQRDHRPGDFEDAIARYKALLMKYPKNPIAHRTLMFIGLNYLARGNFFGALGTFQAGVRDYPDSPFYWKMRVAIGEAFRNLGKFDDALATFKAVESDPKSQIYGVEASYRAGDVLLNAGKYQSAIDEYKSALAKHPQHWRNWPNAFFNTAESYFWLENYQASLESYRDFIQKFAANSYGGYAMTRLGEIMEILGAPSKKVQGAFLESVFRYRGSEGAAIARMRLNSAHIKDMKPAELAAALKENAELSEKVKIEHMDEYKTLIEADGFLEAKWFGRAAEALTNQYRKDPQSPHMDLFKNHIEQGLTKNIQYLNSKKDYLQALQLYTKNQDSWLEKVNRVDSSYSIAESYKGMNLLEQSESFFKKALNELYSSSDKQLQKRKVFETPVTADQINLKLSDVALQQGDTPRSAAYLRAIRAPQALTPDESLERSLVIAKIAEKESQYETAYVALKDVVDKWRGVPSKLAEPWYKIAEILAHEKKDKEALLWTKKVVETYKDTLIRRPASQDPATVGSTGATDPEKSGVKSIPSAVDAATEAADEKLESPVDVSVVRKAAELQGDLWAKQGKIEEAAKSYLYLIEKLSDDYPVGSVRYKLGKLYFDRGNLKEAAKQWAELKKDLGGQVWSKIAQENLDHSQWQDKYKRYVDGNLPKGPMWAPENKAGEKK